MVDGLFVSPKIAVRRSPLHGRGVFAREPIPAGELIEECHYAVVDSTSATLDQRLNAHLFTWPKGGTALALVFGGGMIYNHSDRPNIAFRTDEEDDLYRFFALRPIAEGEELCHDYGPHATDDIRSEAASLARRRASRRRAAARSTADRPRLLVVTVPGRDPRLGDSSTASCVARLIDAGLNADELHGSLLLPATATASGWRDAAADRLHVAIDRCARAVGSAPAHAALVLVLDQPEPASVQAAAARALIGRLRAARPERELLTVGAPLAGARHVATCAELALTAWRAVGGESPAATPESPEPAGSPDYSTYLEQYEASGWATFGPPELPVDASRPLRAVAAEVGRLAAAYPTAGPLVLRGRAFDRAGSAALIDRVLELPALLRLRLKLGISVCSDVGAQELQRLARHGVRWVRPEVDGLTPLIRLVRRAAAAGIGVRYTLPDLRGAPAAWLPYLIHLPPPERSMSGAAALATWRAAWRADDAYGLWAGDFILVVDRRSGALRRGVVSGAAAGLFDTGRESRSLEPEVLDAARLCWRAWRWYLELDDGPLRVLPLLPGSSRRLSRI